MRDRLSQDGFAESREKRGETGGAYVRPKLQENGRRKYSVQESDPIVSERMQLERQNLFQKEEADVISRVQNRLREQFGNRINKETYNPAFQSELREAIEDGLKKEAAFVKTVEMRESYKKHIYHLLTGFGPLEELFDKGYSEIEVATYQNIFVEENGKMRMVSDVRFKSEDELLSIIKARIAEPNQRPFDSSHPLLDARLPDGSRVNAVMAPVSLDGTRLTIRRFPPIKMTEQDYLNYGTIDQRGLDIIEYLVRAKATIVVSGGTGSGKTTLLNVVSNMLAYDPGQAVITIEDTPELRLSHPNVRRTETKPGNGEGGNEVTTTDLIKNTMRERPDRIIIGEIRDGAMADFLRIATSGHEGGFTTVHNNAPSTLEGTIQLLVQMSDTFHLSEKSVRYLYGNGVDIVIQIRRFPDQVRRITHITHVVGYGMDAVNELRAYGELVPEEAVDRDKIYLRDIYRWEKLPGNRDDGTLNGHFITTGYVPGAMVERGDQYGAPRKKDLFDKYDSAEGIK